MKLSPFERLVLRALARIIELLSADRSYVYSEELRRECEAGSQNGELPQ